MSKNPITSLILHILHLLLSFFYLSFMLHVFFFLFSFIFHVTCFLFTYYMFSFILLNPFYLNKMSYFAIFSEQSQSHIFKQSVDHNFKASLILYTVITFHVISYSDMTTRLLSVISKKCLSLR